MLGMLGFSKVNGALEKNNADPRRSEPVDVSERDVTHAVGASGDTATHDENGESGDDVDKFSALSGEKDGDGGGSKAPVAKPSKVVAPMLKWGKAYQPADVNLRPGDSLNRTQWDEAHKF